MSTATIDASTGLITLSFVRDWLVKLLETLSDEQMLHQPVPGANHGLWITGHLAWCDDMFLSQIGGAESATPAAWKELFGNGSEPTPDASDYPPRAEVRGAFDANRRSLREWVAGLDEAALGRPLPEDWKDFAPSYGALVHKIAGHEAVHLGQLTVVRRSLGMKPVMG